jgi:thiamine biosynthesis lipoprotein
VNAREPETVIYLTDTAMATSGDYRNFFESGGKRYSHTIDTRTGRPVTHALASVTVIDARGSRADALATALLVMGPGDGLALAERENLAVLFLVRSDGSVDEIASPAFQRLRSSG